MSTKQVRNVGVISMLSLLLALGAGIGSSMSAGAQAPTATGNDKPDPAHPVVLSVSANSVLLATTPDSSREVSVGPSTVVIKDGKFAGVSALKAGDKVQVNPSITLPNGLEGHGTSSAPPAPPQDDPANPNKTQIGNSNNSGSGQTDAGGSTTPSAPQAPPDPDNKSIGAPTDAGQLPDDGGASTTSSTASIIWVTSNDDQLFGGVVHWVQGSTAILNIPGVGYSEYAIHTTSATGYQKMTSLGTALSASSASEMSVGASVVVLGTDGLNADAGFFTVKAVLVLPASVKLR